MAGQAAPDAVDPGDVDVLTPAFFARPADRVGPDLVGCVLWQRREDGRFLRGLVVETEAYSQSEPACHGHRRRSPSNETLFGPPGRFYVYVSHGIHHCVNVVTDREDWANGVLLRAVAMPDEPERIAAGPGLLARRFGLDRRHDGQPVDPAGGLWLAPRPPALVAWWQQQDQQGRDPLVTATRIGITPGADLPWRWYLKASRSVSRRARGDRTPSRAEALGTAELLPVAPRVGAEA
ncbi:DNA-3-methyladenine glycosylase [Synechococcus sp. BSF8S]|uniref:DNA-3-methyladenine glycosylase n=1 Tax=Synechococcales TaxID=1890424 RepID=UPI001625EC2C|nr:DNA-3-methyladenine glycosylase [Synechococcus sp. BSF8S]MBC1264649.1 DNA-3-methyladenine glycosylase [Synechococcus sp. BSA11S]